MYLVLMRQWNDEYSPSWEQHVLLGVRVSKEEAECLTEIQHRDIRKACIVVEVADGQEWPQKGVL